HLRTSMPEKLQSRERLLQVIDEKIADHQKHAAASQSHEQIAKSIRKTAHWLWRDPLDRLLHARDVRGRSAGRDEFRQPIRHNRYADLILLAADQMAQ